MSGSPSDGLALPAEPYLRAAPPHRPRWFGDLGIVAAALAIIAVIAGTLSWCDFTLATYKLSAPVPLLLCPGGPSAGEVPADSTIRFSAVYSGSFGEFRELATVSTTGSETVTGWAEGDVVDAGARFGVMKFGSRMDVFLPRDSALRVQPGDRVTAGVTVIAVLPEGPHRGRQA